MEDVKKKLLALSDVMWEDVLALRENGEDQRIGLEVMIANSLCNIAKTLKEIG